MSANYAAGLRVFLPAADLYVSYCGEAREGFSSVAESRNVFEVVERRNFACCVVGERERKFSECDTGAVILNNYSQSAAVFEGDTYTFCESVYRVFYEFFYGGGRAFYDFTCGDS